MKKVLSVILAVVIAASLAISAFAAQLTATQAEDIALNDAGVARANAQLIPTSLERDDGKTYYEIEFYATVNGNIYEYEYEVDANSGRITERDYDLHKLGAPVVKGSNVAKTGKVKLTWNAVAGAVNYMVYRSTTKNGVYTHVLTTTNTSYINTGAGAGKTYYYKVRAIARDHDESSDYSAVVTRTCDLARPVVNTAVNSKGNPKLTWNAVSGAVSYKVYRATSANGTYKLIKTTTNKSFTNTSVTAGRTYYYKVVAVSSNTNANSAYSTVVNATAR